MWNVRKCACVSPLESSKDEVSVQWVLWGRRSDKKTPRGFDGVNHECCVVCLCGSARLTMACTVQILFSGVLRRVFLGEVRDWLATPWNAPPPSVGEHCPRHWRPGENKGGRRCSPSCLLTWVRTPGPSSPASDQGLHQQLSWLSDFEPGLSYSIRFPCHQLDSQPS